MMVTNRAQPPRQQPFVMQREDERARVALAGQRPDTGEAATLLAVQDLSGFWVFSSPLGEPGIRINREDAQPLVEALKDAGGAR